MQNYDDLQASLVQKCIKTAAGEPMKLEDVKKTFTSSQLGAMFNDCLDMAGLGQYAEGNLKK